MEYPEPDATLINRSATIDKDGKRKVVLTFAVVTGADSDDDLDAYGLVNIDFGDAYIGDVNLRAIGFSAQQDMNLREWTVTVTFEKPPDTEPNPLERPIELSGSFNGDSEPMQIAEDGTPVLNSAGDFFTEAVMRDNPRQFFTIKRNEAVYPVLLAHNYRRAINADWFLGLFPPKTCKVAGIGFTLVRNDEYGDYYEITYDFETNAAGFNAKVLDQGKFSIQGSNRLPITERNVPIDDPLPLDGHGAQLLEGQQPVILEFQQYPILPFSMFNFSL